MKKIIMSLCALSSFLFLHSDLAANSWNIRSRMNSNGDSVCAWQNFDGSSFDLQTVSISSTGVISSMTELGVLTTSIDTNPVLAINNSGKIMIIWTAIDDNLGINALRMNYFDGTTWLPVSVQISDNTENVSNNNYTVHLSDSDWVVITWSSHANPTSENIVRTIYGTLGNLSGPITLG